MSAINKDIRVENIESLNSFTERDTRSKETHQNTASQDRQNHITPTPAALPAGQWLRAVLGFEAPFGHDGLPTVWG